MASVFSSVFMLFHQAFVLDERHDRVQALAALQVAEHEGPLAAHLLRVPVHDLERRADHGREVDLVDDQQVRLGDARAALARDLVTGGDVDHVEGEVGQLRAESRSEVVASRFDEDDLEVAEGAVQPRYGLEVDRGVLADRGVRAAAGLHADDALGRERLVSHQELRVLLGIDVVRDDGESISLAQRAAQRERERRLAGTDRTANTYPERRRVAHDLNSRLYCVSWREESSASAGAKLPRASSSNRAARRASSSSLSPRETSMRWPSVCPSGSAFTAASTWFSSHDKR